MNTSAPHYLLSSETNRSVGLGRWRFVLRAADGSVRFEAADVEPDVWGERLDLLTVVRALESLDQPSKVTLVGCTRYVEQGVQFGMSEWRDNGWRWEYFGQMAPVRDADLWQRMEHTLQFHKVDCGQRRFDAAEEMVAGPHWDMSQKAKSWGGRVLSAKWLKYYTPLLAAWGGILIVAAIHLWQKARGLGVQGSGFST
jgi:ribonuclease HI